MGIAVSKGAGLGMAPCRIRRKASWRVSTPRMAVVAGSKAGVLPSSCCWSPMTLPKLVEVIRLAMARKSSKVSIEKV